LLADQAVADVVESGTAVLRRQGRAQQAQARDLRDEVDREAALVEAIADDRQHARIGEARDAVLDRALLVAEQGTDVVEIVGMQGHRAARGGKVSYCTVGNAPRAATRTGRQSRPVRSDAGSGQPRSGTADPATRAMTSPSMTGSRSPGSSCSRTVCWLPS